jgi:hypothetical protein
MCADPVRNATDVAADGTYTETDINACFLPLLLWRVTWWLGQFTRNYRSTSFCSSWKFVTVPRHGHERYREGPRSRDRLCFRWMDGWYWVLVQYSVTSKKSRAWWQASRIAFACLFHLWSPRHPVKSVWLANWHHVHQGSSRIPGCPCPFHQSPYSNSCTREIYRRAPIFAHVNTRFGWTGILGLAHVPSTACSCCWCMAFSSGIEQSCTNFLRRDIFR